MNSREPLQKLLQRLAATKKQKDQPSL